MNHLNSSKIENSILELLKITFSHDDLINENKLLFKFILSKYHIKPNISLKNYNCVNFEFDNIKNCHENEKAYKNFLIKLKDLGIEFLSEIYDDDKNSLIAYLNQNNNEILNEVLLSIFDEDITDYFNSQTNDQDKILNQSLAIFKALIYYIDINNYEINTVNKLGMLYCISYIKCYCYHLCKILNCNDSNNLDMSEIFEFLKDSSKSKKVIKIYILRVLNKIIFNNYLNLLDFIKQKQLFVNDFDFSENNQFPLNNIFLQKDSYKTYIKMSDLYKISKMENYENKLDKLVEEINMNTILSFYDLIINEEISKLCSNEQFNEIHYKKLCNFLTGITENIQLSPISKNLLSIFYNYSLLKEELTDIKKLHPNDYEILLYAYKFAFICSLSLPDTVYSNILSPNAMENIKKVYIPGGEPVYNILIDSANEIKEYFEKRSSNVKYGAYICSCGKSYYIENCTQPSSISICSYCKEKIGGTNHRLIEREGHMRIFLNEEEKLNFKSIPGKLLKDLLYDVEILTNNHYCGFKRISKGNLLSIQKRVRNMNNITYRVLSFIFYSCILFNRKLSYITDDDLNIFLYEDNDQNQSILSILVDIWNTLNIELCKRGIENKVQCFMNMVLPDISKLISNNVFKMEEEDERDVFERKCNDIIESALSFYKFNNFYHNYIENSNEILDDNGIKNIIEEYPKINSLFENNYPIFKYFCVSDYSSFDNFYHQFNELSDKTTKYPVLTTYFEYLIENSEKMKILDNFSLINPLVKYALKKYSNKVSREEAKKIKIASELKKDKYMEKLFKDFKKGWNEVYELLSNFDCHGKLNEFKIDENCCLSYILNDFIEDGYGKYIATYYHDVISIQNDILRSMTSNIHDKEYLQKYYDQFNDPITVQDATSSEIISFNNIKNKIYKSFDNLIFIHSKRDYVKEPNGEINYINYKRIKYNFNNIEIGLSNLLLPGKRLFKSKDEQTFFIFKFESFTHNFNIIYDFKQKFKSEQGLSHKCKESIKNTMQKFNYSNILSYLQQLFVYFSNKKNTNDNSYLLKEIKQLPNNAIELNDDFTNFHNVNKLNLKMNQLISLYNYIESLNFNKLKKQVSLKAYNKLSNEQIQILNQHFNKKNLLIKRKDYYQAIQKVISRYLISEQFKNYKWNIFTLLSKPELWNDELTNTPEKQNKFEEELELLNTNLENENCDITIDQSMDLYSFLNS